MVDFFGIFSKSRKKKNVKTERRVKSKTKTKIKGVGYDSNLIDNLESDHEVLVDVFGKVWKEGVEQNDYRALTRYLAEFKSKFQGHLLKENVKFYAYLEQSMKGDDHSLGVVREFRRDMNDIANAVIGFCKKYETPEQAKELLSEFKKEYQDIGQALVRRVQLEERDLYSLYVEA